jgi:hypothetical protein
MTGQSLSDLVRMGVDVAEPGPVAVAPEFTSYRVAFSSRYMYER